MANILYSFASSLPFFLPLSAPHTLHRPPGDASVRCEQLDLLLQWGAEFRQSSSQAPAGEKVLEDLVAFDVILGDLNFDNCSSGRQLLMLLLMEIASLYVSSTLIM